jgi:hypothetical protein
MANPIAVPGTVVPSGSLTTPGGAQGVAGAGITFKGTVATFSSLPGTGNNYGDLWITNDTGHGWIWSTGAVPSFVQKAYIQAGTAASTTITYANAQMSADTNVIAITYGRSGANPITVTVSSVTDTAGNTYTASPLGLVQEVGGGSDGVGTIIYYCSSINAWTAGNAVTVTLSGTANFLAVEILEYTGLAGLDVSVSAKVNSPGASTAINSGSATTTAVNDLIFGFCCGWDGGLAGGSGFTVRNAVYLILVEDKAAPSIGAYNVTGTAGGTNGWAAQLLAFKAAASSWTDSGLWRGPPGPTAVSTDAGNIATLGSDSLILVPQSTIWSARLRSYQALGNNTFEVDQRNVGNAVTYPAGTSGSMVCDRWGFSKSAATATFSSRQFSPTAIVVPGTNFRISNGQLIVTLTATQATLAAGEYIQLAQSVEGPQLRELIGDVHSLSLLVYCTNAPLTFSVRLSAPGAPIYTLTKLCTITTASQWTMFNLPNLPVFTPSATWTLTPGNIGYSLGIGLGAGTTYTSPANDTWQSGNYVTGPGTTNFASLPVNTQFICGFVQHEPGALCSNPPMDCKFTDNYDSCLRYYQKTYDYATAVGAASISAGIIGVYNSSTTQMMNMGTRFKKPMAKIPTVTVYNHVSGVINSVQDWAAVTHAVSSVSGSSTESPFYQLTTSGVTAGQGCWTHYTADTGW